MNRKTIITCIIFVICLVFGCLIADGELNVDIVSHPQPKIEWIDWPIWLNAYDSYNIGFRDDGIVVWREVDPNK